jgi:hypothetical protein
MLNCKNIVNPIWCHKFTHLQCRLRIFLAFELIMERRNKEPQEGRSHCDKLTSMNV